MNAKKNKNKKANKPPNPTPPQKEEKEKVQEKIESEISDRADIISDIVPEPDVEVPKKPKRNRGKKKKQDKDEDEKTEEKTSDKVLDEKNTTSETEINIEAITTEFSKAIEPISNPVEKEIELADEVPKIENVLKTDPFEQETKHSKKKNKKKKRHDSDRSDKSGDALSCTAAFQKLLDVSDEKPLQTPQDIEHEDAKTIEDIILSVPEEDKASDIGAVKLPSEVKTSDTEILAEDKHEFQEVQKHESKKKKNKKDKKHPPKSDDLSILMTSEPSIAPEPVCDTKNLTDIIPDQIQITIIPDLPEQHVLENVEHISDSNKSEKEAEEILTPLIEDTTEKGNAEIIPEDVAGAEISKSDKGSPKPKAKIAKPVDKKRKGKQESAEISSSDIFTVTPDAIISEQTSSIMSLPLLQDLPQKEDVIIDAPELQELLEPIQQLQSDTTTSTVTEEIKLDTNPVPEILALIPQETKVVEQEIKETLPPIEPKLEEPITPAEVKTGKKKRKPLKMPMPAPIIPEAVKSLEEMTTEMIKEGKDEIGDVDVIFETLVPTDIEVKATDEKLDEILESKDEPNASIEIVSPATSEQSEEKWIKPKRKGKKSIKMPPTPGVTEEKFDLDTESKTAEPTKETEVPLHTPTDTLEIRSVKADDSECSPCDVAPDIVYPRSTSQINIDDNNNTVIREISIPDTLNLPVGLTTPLIQGSGETPVGTPIMVSSFNITELESPTEKTDLKSKVMEVNKDMEELRLSIERSIAELTAMEKSEEEVEKKYEETHPDNLDVKPSEIDIPKQEEIKTSNKESIDVQLQPEYIPPITEKLPEESERTAPLATHEDDKDLDVPRDITECQPKKDDEKPLEKTQCSEPPPVCPARRDNKGKGKKRKGKQDASQPTTPTQTTTETAKEKKEEKTEQKTTKQESKQNTKQKDDDEMPSNEDNKTSDPITDADYDPIDKFEDALATGVDDVDVNKTFEMILNEVTESNQKELASNKPDIKIIAAEEDFREGSVPQPKNLLGHPNIPVSSNKDDFKKEKHKNLNTKQAKVKIKDANEVEGKKESKQSQTESRNSKDLSLKKSNENGEFIYKYSFRKVFLQNTCHVCARELSSVRVPCNFCNLLFYCSIKHKDEDWPHHQALCFAISTIVHLKDQKHIYAEAKNITGQNYRLLRMQMILSCEKVLKRRLVPWEQEALLYPRVCADVRCREWRQSKLKDCDGCGQISYCASSLDHLPLSHQRWCKSYALYQKLVTHQQTKGRLDPKLPTKVMAGSYEIPEKINEVLASMYEEQIDMNDIQYAALTQIATGPLTVAYSDQLYRKATKPSSNGIFKKSSFVIHVLGAELQFEADVLNKWEVFFLHLRPDVNELVVVLINNNLNPGNLPLELLGKIRLCEGCQQNKRRVIFSFQDKKTYQEYRTCDDFIYPNIVCTFNASINRSSYNDKDQWPGIITSVMRLRSPFLITSHTPTELHRDLIRIKECGDVKVMVEPTRNPFASVRPDRNFITDDETPLLFKNQCFAVLCGV